MVNEVERLEEKGGGPVILLKASSWSKDYK